MSRFLGAGFDQLRHMMADYLLGVLIEGRRMPHGAAISQGAKAGVEVIVTVLDQFDRDRQPKLGCIKRDCLVFDQEWDTSFAGSKEIVINK